ncbi:MAG TPA: dienelactone hydrolase family protein, partial [Anaerolineaceae bacterium]|nr:dienelactone hydrolase family protein [Anaerolineaceae bacterium]
VVIAPALYDGKTATTIEEAKLLRGKMKRAQAQEEILSALTTLRTHPALTSPALGLVGFSLGAYFALGLAAEHPESIQAVTLFYGTRNADYSASHAAYLGHYAEHDIFESTSGIRKLEKNLRAAGCPATFFTYPGTGHWFFERDRADAYAPESAELAWERTIEFLHHKLDQE